MKISLFIPKADTLFILINVIDHESDNIHDISGIITKLYSFRWLDFSTFQTVGSLPLSYLEGMVCNQSSQAFFWYHTGDRIVLHCMHCITLYTRCSLCGTPVREGYAGVQHECPSLNKKQKLVRILHCTPAYINQWSTPLLQVDVVPKAGLNGLVSTKSFNIMIMTKIVFMVCFCVTRLKNVFV